MSQQGPEFLSLYLGCISLVAAAATIGDLVLDPQSITANRCRRFLRATAVGYVVCLALGVVIFAAAATANDMNKLAKFGAMPLAQEIEIAIIALGLPLAGAPVIGAFLVWLPINSWAVTGTAFNHPDHEHGFHVPVLYKIVGALSAIAMWATVYVMANWSTREFGLFLARTLGSK